VSISKSIDAVEGHGSGRELSAAPLERVAAVDGLRGLLAVVVVLWHACAPVGAPWLLEAADLAVGMFFVLSGYALTRGWSGHFSAFLVRRIIRLWPVYALCLGVGYMVAGVHPVWSEFLWYPIISVDAKPAIDPPVWSLFLEVYMMPFMPVVLWASNGSILKALLCMSVLMMVGLLAPQISIGALFIGGAFFARTTYRSRFLQSAAPQWLGRISYSLYLSNWIVLTVAKRALGPWGGIAALPAVFAIAYLVWRLVERPSITASRRIGRAIETRILNAAASA
jgi:peptidoglycan/LPS O-acetylase OafA/YrhL